MDVRRKAEAKPFFLAALALPFALASGGVANAADSCEFFKGKTVEMVVPFSAGGGFDTYGRMVAKFMGDQLGAANMIVRNQPGAGGLLATNQTWATKPDGLTIQLIAISGMVAAELGGADGVLFKTNEFSWIGRISGEPDVITTAPDGGIKTGEDVRAIAAERKVRVGSTGLGSPQYIGSQLLAMFMDDGRVITGFSGSQEVYTSLQRGELDLFVSSLSAAEAAEKAETGRVLWIFGTEGLPERPNVPPLSSAVDAKFERLIQVQADITSAGRALAGPPGMDKDRLQCLRDAFDRTMASDELKAEAKMLNRPIEPLAGSQLAALIGGAMSEPPPEYLKVLRSSFNK
ncbi:Tripartite tricarboxylate transporter family receptor [Hartmannibacter diazotrophicus]|uniref:Tripartite tricarboxylate transporter family receptor n=2 Tax=Hartmannibacter diazotrophicus TaxID=1482074 RepID=A0A2C9DAI2_9HYPH|nr:Tripartite tricarboxylate transporter family receptor [Hartmannibacter diazotrophicus]